MLKVGIIGAGMVAREHARSMAQTDGRVGIVAVADTAIERLADFCNEFDVAHRYGEGAELIRDPNVDIVVVTTPPSAHEVLTIAALDAGKYVLCEKPLAHSLAAARRIADAEARNPGRLAVSYQFRYEPQFRRLVWLIKNGWIGELQSALIARHSFIPYTGPGSWWGVWSVSGGGVLITQLIHELDMLELVMGKAIAVTAEMDTRFTDIESEDFLQATIRFESGRTARCVAAVNSGYLGGGVEFQGTAGTVGIPEGLMLNDPLRQAKARVAVEQAVPVTGGADSLLGLAKRLLDRGAEPDKRLHTLLYLEIADAIAQSRPLPIPVSDAYRSLELCMAMYESTIAGAEVTLPLSPDNLVYEGVRKADYDARRCHRTLTAPAAFRRADRKSPLTVRSGLVRLVKGGLALANLDTAIVRAVLRKPPAVHGGPKVRRLPWPARRHFDNRERAAAMRLLTKEMKTGGALVYEGPEEAAYCAAFAKYLGGGYADAVNSGSNAIYITLRALGIEPGREIVVPPITDPGATMPVVLNLCTPIPADSSPGSILTSAEEISKVLSNRTAAIIVAHMGGHAVDMDPILELAAERGIHVVEDCAQAHGTRYKDRMVGSMGSMSAFSTMFGKQHSTGGQGGVVFTKDPILFARAKQVADRGKLLGPDGSVTNVIGSMNFNQDELSMAIGRVQLDKLPVAVMHRRNFAALVGAGLDDVKGVELIRDPPNSESSYWYLMLRLNPAIIGCTSNIFATALLKEGIEGVNAGYSVYPTDQVWHRDAVVFGKSRLPWSLIQDSSHHYALPNAHEANDRMVRVEVHESLHQREAKDLVAAIRKLAEYYSH